MARIAVYEPLVSLGSKVSYRAEQGCPLARVKDLSPFERGRPLPPSEGNGSKSLTLKTERLAKPLTVAAGENDVYLKDSRMINIVGALTGAATVARITPENYAYTTQVLYGDITEGTPPNQNYKKFKVTLVSTPQLYVGSNGKLTYTQP